MKLRHKHVRETSKGWLSGEHVENPIPDASRGIPLRQILTEYLVLLTLSVLSEKFQIRSFPSKEFYEDALEDGDDIEGQTTRDWHKYRCFGPFCFFDIHEGKESQHPGATGSRVNLDEVEFVLLIYQKLVTMYPELKSSSQLAIISPYSFQVKTFKSRFKEMFGEDAAKKMVDINTIDGFQVNILTLFLSFLHFKTKKNVH